MTNSTRKPLRSSVFTSVACALTLLASACTADAVLGPDAAAPSPDAAAPSPDASASADAAAPSPDTSASADASPPGADLEGTWQTPCYQSAQTRLVYANFDLTGTYTEYSDTACTTPRHVATWKGRAAVGEEVTPGVRKLNLSFTAFRSTALTAAEADSVNQNKYCGISDWAAGVERDVLGLECYGFAIPVGGKSLDLYKVDGATLLFGKGSKILAAPTEADRPTELEPTRPFTRR